MHERHAILGLVLTGLLLSGYLGMTGCNKSGTGGGGGGTVLASAGDTSQLYVSGNTLGRLLSYNDANTVSGSDPVNRVVSGGLTTLNGPRGIAVDMPHNQIYVANYADNSILVFNDARTVTGGDAPSRTIRNASVLIGPSALFIDAVHDRLYVANTGGNSVLIFDNASSLSGSTVAPDRILTGVSTTLSAPTGIYVDTTRNLLYVSNGNQVLVFSNAASTAGDTAPARTIGGLSSPAGLFADVMTDRLYVANTGSNSILVYNNASTANGTPAPDRTLSGGATLLNQPRDLFLDTGTDRLYVSNAGSNTVLVYNGASTANGAPAPDRVVDLTASTGPWGIFVDVTPMVIGSTASLDGFITFDGTTYAATSNGGSPITGDDESFLTGSSARQFFNFDLSNIPTNVTVNAATLRLYQAAQVGTPFNDLGNVVADHVDYGASLDGSPGDYDGGLLAFMGIFSTSSNVGYRTLDATSAVADDIIIGRGHSQYRLRFSPLGINYDSSSDYVQYTDAEDSCCGANRPPQLEITLLP